MIHFNFTVSDEDAENILGCIHNEITQCNQNIMKCMVNNDSPEVIIAFRSHIEYLEELILKMTNTRVEA